MKHSFIIALAISALVLVDSPARAAGVPGTMAFSARLLDNGTPFEGTISMRLDLYRSAQPDASVPPIWTEEYQPKAEQGLVAVVMGQQQPLASSLLDGGDLFLEVTITQGGTTTTLAPRLSVGSVPYALMADFARDTAAVPPGAVMHFDLDACPPGWSELTAARGRTIVGGARGEPVGDALGDREDRAHAHSVDPVSVATGAAGAHTHGNGQTQGAEVPHTHSFGQLSGGTNEVWHNHRWSQYDTNKTWWSYGANGNLFAIHQWGNGLQDRGGGGYPLASAPDVLFTDGHSHSHTVTVNGTTTSGANATSHAHGIASDGSHQHSCDVGNTTSTPVTTSQVMPYVQLLVCRKN